MAGGREWILQRKSAGYYSYTTGSEEDGNLRHWRREEVVFEIASSQRGAFRGMGDVGQKSGVFAYSESENVFVSDQAASRVYVCEDHQAERADEASGFYIHSQIWRKIGADEEYNPETGEAV